MRKKLFLLSLGCPKNLVDSEVMLGQLEQAGYCVVETPEAADLLLVNTCGFIRPAVEESIDEILALAEIKKTDPGKRLVVTGCLVQRYGDKLREELPEVDLFIGTDGFQEIAALVDRPPAGLLLQREPAFLMHSTTARRISTPSHRAYLKITEGCANRCSYCMIPALRGELRSRLPQDVVAEAQNLGQAGVQELTLVAQDLTAYGLDLGSDGPRLTSLLRLLLASCRIPWLRLLYLHPGRVDDHLLDLLLAEPRIVPYLDIPLQHVSSRLLRRMNRPYDKARIETMLHAVRNRPAHVALRTTFMVGFPGETETEVEEIADFLRLHCFDHVGIFPFSPEEGTPAAEMDEQVEDEEKEARRDHLMAVQADIALANNEKFIGRVEPVLVEGLSRESDLLVEGRTRYQAPEVDGCVYITAGQCQAGDIVPVRLTEAHPYDLVGEIVTEKDG
ncbi:MAG: 30S ribosomal protein S12 methylthiotransferase RimO [Deltaproteobacteria bacterium CG23_combo_of_CG06-09_8_20_14_all_60_8]|nr:MAG: ribosomal protein S12 methylthiotransferase RimO [Desulfobacterales bacterium CG2_30_60_27]PIP44015.1 MAG: 30S ribosomal protein S12 methylthiotransferase RimO [Deltaproteobacteria bacterium CG23_combo_of_CG06-09_8_20_14_all_60_8]